MTQFRKSASVLIGDPTMQFPFVFNAVVLKKLRIAFKVEKTSEKSPNTAIIHIYNLSIATRNSITELDKYISLSAGYMDGDGEKLLFFGNISGVSHAYAGSEVITTIHAEDGGSALGQTRVSISKGSGFSALTILRQILKTFVLTNNLNTISITDKKYVNGFTYIGTSKNALTKVCEFLGLSWSVQNNEITLYTFSGTDNSRAVYISPKTGLVKSPERLNGAVRKAVKQTKKNKPGWRIHTLLSPDVKPTGRIQVTSAYLPEKSIFTVHSVMHEGDTHGPDFNTLIEVFDNV